MSTADLYPLWRRDAITDVRQKLNSAETALSSLHDQTTIFARSIAAMVDMHREALAVYENSPRSLESADGL